MYLSKGRLGYTVNTLTFTSLVRVVRQALVICVMAPPIHLGAWSMAMAAFFVHLHSSHNDIESDTD